MSPLLLWFLLSLDIPRLDKGTQIRLHGILFSDLINNDFRRTFRYVKFDDEPAARGGRRIP